MVASSEPSNTMKNSEQKAAKLFKHIVGGIAIFDFILLCGTIYRQKTIAALPSIFGLSLSPIICVTLLFLRYTLKPMLIVLHRTLSEKESKSNKFASDTLKLCYYGFCTYLLFTTCLDKEYVPQALGGAENFIHFAEHWPNGAIHNDERRYYELQLGFALQTLIAHFIEPQRRDFREMFIHHILFISLVVFSFLNGWFRIGMSVFIIHDASDAFLYLLKVASSFDNVPFVVFSLLSWFSTWSYLRLYAFPIYVILPAIKYFTTEPVDSTIFSSFLSALFCLHVFWTYKIFQAIWKMVTKGKIEDPVNKPVESKKLPSAKSDLK